MIIIMLGLLIAGSVGLFVYYLTRDSSKAPAGAWSDPGYVCYKCGKRFTLTRGAYGEQTIDPVIAEKDRTAARRPHCPLCHARHAGFMMVSCRKCGKSYLPPTKMPRGSAVTAEAQDRLKPTDILYHLGGYSDEGDTWETQDWQFSEELQRLWDLLVGPDESLRRRILEPFETLRDWKQATILPTGTVTIHLTDGSTKLIEPPTPNTNP